MKTLKKLLIQLVAVAMVVLCISAIPALADYSFGSFYTDYISTCLLYTSPSPRDA